MVWISLSTLLTHPATWISPLKLQQPCASQMAPSLLLTAWRGCVSRLRPCCARYLLFCLARSAESSGMGGSYHSFWTLYQHSITCLDAHRHSTGMTHELQMAIGGSERVQIEHCSLCILLNMQHFDFIAHTGQNCVSILGPSYNPPPPPPPPL